jgi:zinc/manganese transport system substrate-binding protein
MTRGKSGSMTRLVLGILLLSAPAHAKLKVVATVTDLAVIAREIGGDEVDVTALARPAQDPHFVDPRPSLVLDLKRADLLVLIGADLETGWLPSLVLQSRNPGIQRGAPGVLDASTRVDLLEVPTQKIDRSMGDIHAPGNPHYTKDPRNGLRIAAALSEKLAELDPSHASQFAASAARFRDSLAAKIREWQTALAPLKGTKVITYHRSWIYFTSWSGLTEVGHVEPKPGLAPSIGHLAKVLRSMQAQNVSLILIEPWYSTATSETLSEKGHATLLRLPGMAGDNESYAAHMDRLVGAVVQAMAKR